MLVGEGSLRKSARDFGLDRLAREHQPEALDEPWDALGVHFELVAGGEVGQSLRLGLRDAAKVDELSFAEVGIDVALRMRAAQRDALDSLIR